MIADTAPAYIAENYPASKIVFASDIALDDMGLYGKYYTALGGRDAYPFTVIIDENGVIVANFVSSVEYEELKQVIEEQLKK